MRPMRGALLFEVILTLVITMLIGVVVLQSLAGSGAVRDAVQGQSHASTEARQVVDVLASRLANAQVYTVAENQWTVIASASESSIEYYYADDPNAKIRYYQSGSDLVRHESNGTENVVLSGLSKLTFTYYVGPRYNTSNVTELEGAPTAEERESLIAVRISAIIEIDGYEQRYTTLVRFRNSPRKGRV